MFSFPVVVGVFYRKQCETVLNSGLLFSVKEVVVLCLYLSSVCQCVGLTFSLSVARQ